MWLAVTILDSVSHKTFPPSKEVLLDSAGPEVDLSSAGAEFWGWNKPSGILASFCLSSIVSVLLVLFSVWQGGPSSSNFMP